MERHQRQHILQQLEAHRREPGSVTPYPLRNVVDYAGPSAALTLALSHLDEALPAGQRKRAVLAAMLAQSSLAQVLAYMTAAGYFTDGQPQEFHHEVA